MRGARSAKSSGEEQRLTVAGAFAADFFEQPVVDLAWALLGALIVCDGVGGLIVETEAYHHADPAAHSYRGRTARNAAMFGPVGRAYVYRSYGLHWCMNVVGGETPGSAVLIRALEPMCGIDRMRARRGLADWRLLCAGPGRLTQALAITGALDGASFNTPELSIGPGQPVGNVAIGPRIGITKGLEQPWRFGIAGSRFLSRAFPAAPGHHVDAPASPSKPTPRSSPRE